MFAKLKVMIVTASFIVPAVGLAHDSAEEQKELTIVEKAELLAEGAKKRSYDFCQAIYDRKRAKKTICAKMVLELNIDFVENEKFTSCYISFRSLLGYRHPDFIANRCIGKNVDYPYGETFLSDDYLSCVKEETLLDNDTQFYSLSKAHNRCAQTITDKASYKDYSNHFDSDALVD